MSLVDYLLHLRKEGDISIRNGNISGFPLPDHPDRLPVQGCFIPVQQQKLPTVLKINHF